MPEPIKYSNYRRGYMSANIIVPKSEEVRIKQDGFNVILVSSKGASIILPWKAAIEVARGMVAQARYIESKINAPQIINDQAFLTRLGIPLGLTNNPAMKREAQKEAYYNPELRKTITGNKVKGIESMEAVGTPGLIQHPPKEGKDNAKEGNSNGKG
jgi:ligand-binding sensor domain-containing protein